MDKSLCFSYPVEFIWYKYITYMMNILVNLPIEMFIHKQLMCPGSFFKFGLIWETKYLLSLFPQFRNDNGLIIHFKIAEFILYFITWVIYHRTFKSKLCQVNKSMSILLVIQFRPCYSTSPEIFFNLLELHWSCQLTFNKLSWFLPSRKLPRLLSS